MTNQLLLVDTRPAWRLDRATVPRGSRASQRRAVLRSIEAAGRSGRRSHPRAHRPPAEQPALPLADAPDVAVQRAGSHTGVVRRLLTMAVVSLLAAACSADTAGDASVATVPGHEHGEANAIVERVVDGDTIVVDINGNRERVRLLGIDTPESVAVNRPEQCFGRESASYLTSLLPKGTRVTLVRDIESRDQYDRLLAYVVRSSDQLFVNLDLLERGYAGVMIYEPNSFHRELFEAAENDAFRAGIGLWGCAVALMCPSVNVAT